MAAALLGAGCMALGIWLTRRWPLSMPVLAQTGWQLLAGGVMLLPVALTLDAPLPPLTTTQIGAYAYPSLVGALLAYWLFFRGVVRLVFRGLHGHGVVGHRRSCAVVLQRTVLVKFRVLVRSRTSKHAAVRMTAKPNGRIFIVHRVCRPARPEAGSPSSCIPFLGGALGVEPVRVRQQSL